MTAWRGPRNLVGRFEGVGRLLRGEEALAADVSYELTVRRETVSGEPGQWEYTGELSRPNLGDSLPEGEDLVLEFEGGEPLLPVRVFGVRYNQALFQPRGADVTRLLGLTSEQ